VPFPAMAIVFVAGIALESRPVAIILAPIFARDGIDPIQFAVGVLVGASIRFITPLCRPFSMSHPASLVSPTLDCCDSRTSASLGPSQSKRAGLHSATLTDKAPAPHRTGGRRRLGRTLMPNPVGVWSSLWEYVCWPNGTRRQNMFGQKILSCLEVHGVQRMFEPTHDMLLK
jgi:hypothetical protein